MKKIGILTGGSDCPGLNSVIRAVVRKGMQEGYVITGIKKGWQGLVNNDMKILDLRQTSGILDRGGTILGTSRIDPTQDKEQVERIKENYKRSGIDALIAVGGEDTLKVALQLYEKGIIDVVGIPKSIDNALNGTDYAFGFDTAVNIAVECIDRLHTTAESHHRIMVIEVMGRHTGWIAVEAGIAGGADIILVPEVVTSLEDICVSLRERYRRGKSFSIIVVSEGTHIKGVNVSGDERQLEDRRRFSGVAEQLAKEIEDETGFETRVSVLGYIQRGGVPSAYDRRIATQFGVKAVELVKEKNFGSMVSLKNNSIRFVDIADAVNERKTVNMELMDIAKVFTF